MSELMDYLPVLLTAVLGLTLMTNVIVQVLKGLLYIVFPQICWRFSLQQWLRRAPALPCGPTMGFPLRGG